ncbi:MAG: rhodanese-like domain-containing protein [Acidimicrobiales bacterium]|nr:rhodanese-like domain-containing protein [Acidimicrobiales bacterium]
MEPEQLRDQLEDTQLIDVREDDEWAQGHIDGAVHIPMDEIEDRMSEVSTESPIVTVCRSGQRSGEVADQLRERGLDAENLEGGVQAWVDAGHELVDDDGARGRVA